MTWIHASGLGSCGLTMNQSKSELFHKDAEQQLWAQAMKRTSQGTVVLGAAIGSEEFVTEHYIDLAQQTKPLLKGIRDLHSFLLLSFCANRKVSHITRLSPPKETERATALHDDLIADALASLLGLACLPAMALKQARLKSCNGGLGLSSACDQRESAFLSSWSKTLTVLPDRVPLLSDELQSVVDPHSDLKSARALRHTLQSVSRRLVDFDVDIEDLSLAHQRLRSDIEEGLEKLRVDHLLQHADQRSKARLLSVACKESGAWFAATPMTQHLSLSPEEFTLAAHMRLGLPLPLARDVTTCPNRNCSAEVDEEGFHLLSCGKGPGRVRLHDRMVRVWHGLVLAAGLQAFIEKRDQYSDQRRPDIVVSNFRAGKDLHLDFSATNPCLPSNVSSASRTPGAAAEKRERVKCLRYGDCTGEFEPLVFEHTGRWGPAAIRFLDCLARQARVNVPDVTVASFKRFCLQRLACEWQKGLVLTLQQNRNGWRHELPQSLVHPFV